MTYDLIQIFYYLQASSPRIGNRFINAFRRGAGAGQEKAWDTGIIGFQLPVGRLDEAVFIGLQL